MDITSVDFPVRPIRQQGESLVGYVNRFYWANGHPMPGEMRKALFDLYFGKGQQAALSRIGSVFSFLGFFSDSWWISHRIDFIAGNARHIKWLRFQDATFRYCPHCLKENDVHLELWTLPLIDACARHNCELMHWCSVCNQRTSWANITSGWYCGCGASLLDSAPVEAKYWPKHFAKLFENVVEPIEQKAIFDEFYKAMLWAQDLRKQLCKEQYTGPKPKWYRPRKQNVNRAPGAWEGSLLFSDEDTRLKRITRLLRWNFRDTDNTIVALNSWDPLASALDYVEEIPWNKYTLDLYVSAKVTIEYVKICSNDTLDVYIHPQAIYWEAKEGRFSLWWREFSHELGQLEPESMLSSAVSQEDTRDQRAQFVADILGILLAVACGNRAATHVRKLTRRWQVPDTVREITDVQKPLEELANYLCGLRYSELMYVRDLLCDEGIAAG